MLLSTRYLQRFTVLAKDDEAGGVDDLFFADDTWEVRYLVVRTGWWAGRKVLIAPEAVIPSAKLPEQLMLRVSKEQVENSPDVGVDQPISASKLRDLHRYYMWNSPYWLPGEPALTAPMPPPGPPLIPEPGRDRNEEEQSRPHLRSAVEVINYHIEARDGEIGHVEDLLVDDQEWTIRYLVIDTRNWWPGKKVLISVADARKIGWEEHKLYLDRTQEEIRRSPAFDPSRPVTRDYETSLHDHYNWPKYWS